MSETVISARAARATLADLMQRAYHDDERIVITRNGKPVAALISANALAEYQAWEDERDAAQLREALAADSGERHSMADVMGDVLRRDDTAA